MGEPRVAAVADEAGLKPAPAQDWEAEEGRTGVVGRAGALAGVVGCRWVPAGDAGMTGDRLCTSWGGWRRRRVAGAVGSMEANPRLAAPAGLDAPGCTDGVTE